MIERQVTWTLPADVVEYVDFVRSRMQKRSRSIITQEDAARWIMKQSLKANAMKFYTATKGRALVQQIQALMD